MKKLTAIKNEEVIMLIQTEDDGQINYLKNMCKAMGAAVTVEDITEQIQLELSINEAKSFLASTDWVVTKIAEASLMGQDTAPLLEKYADIIQQRIEKRNLL